MSLTFYFSPMSTATVVYWALAELGVPHERVRINLGAGDQQKPDFLALNPNGKVPLIVHDGTPIFESAAILMHLGETFGVEKGLYPAPGVERALVQQWLVWCNVSLGAAVSRIYLNTGERIPAEEKNAAAAAAGQKDVHKHLGILDAALAGKQYLVGERFTFADLNLAGWMSWFAMMGIELAAYPNITGWVARCTSRPAFSAESREQQ